MINQKIPTSALSESGVEKFPGIISAAIAAPH